jgi:hypothetical protein
MEQNNVSCKQAPVPSWLDSISNISFGALFSEASPYLEGGNPSQNKNFQALQAAITCDSFDAAIGALIAGQKPLNNHMGPPKAANHSSIWDGEETCHAFVGQKTQNSAPLAEIEHTPPKDVLCSEVLLYFIPSKIRFWKQHFNQVKFCCLLV